MAINTYQIPFLKESGELVQYPELINDDFIEYKDNFEFLATMKIQKIENTQDGASLELIDLYGRKYNMFFNDFKTVIQYHKIQFAHFDGTFTFVKRNGSFGVVWLKS